LRFVRINQLLADLNGAPVADHVGKSVHEMAPDIAAAAEDRLRQVLDTGLPSTRLVFSGTTTAQPGVMHTWRESIFPLLDREHKAQGVVVSLEDITEQQRLADELRHSRDDEQRRSRELECVLHVCPAGMLIASDRACLRVKANPAAERLLRLGRGASASLSAPGVAAFALYAGGREVPVEQLPLQRAATFGDQTWGADMTVRFADGDELRIVVNAVPLHDERGEIIGAVLGFAAADAETAATGLAA
jgi:PAS domain-containing protein